MDGNACFFFPKAPKVPLDVIRAADLGEPWAEMQLSKAADLGDEKAIESFHVWYGNG